MTVEKRPLYTCIILPSPGPLFKWQVHEANNNGKCDGRHTRYLRDLLGLGLACEAGIRLEPLASLVCLAAFSKVRKVLNIFH